MEKLITLITMIILCFGLKAQLPEGNHVGIGTDDPHAVLDVNGDVIFRTTDILIDQGINLALDVNTNKFSSYRITIDGDEDQYSVGGITAGMDGRLLTLFNSNIDFTIKLKNEDPNAVPANRIITGNDENFILKGLGIVSLQYDTSVQRWIVKSSNQAVNTTLWETSGPSIFFNDFVGIGTDDPIAPLTISTGLNEAGFLHKVDGFPTLATSISDVAASIGTTTENVFSLNAGGVGKVHVWPDGRVVIGDDMDPTDLAGADDNSSRSTPIIAKLTLETPVNSTGFMHIGGEDEIILREGIGSVSASIGTETSHTFRLTSSGLGRIHIEPNGQVIIGTNLQPPVGQLTVYTPNNTNGLTQVGGDGQIVAMRIGGSSASIGTWTPHIMRIVSNGLSRMDIRDNGQIVIGTGDSPPHGTAKLTVHTANNTDGLVQVGGEGQVLAMRIGGSSGSIGTWTNHIMRIVANGIAAINIDGSGNIAMGTADPLPGYKLSVDGNIKARELVIETTGWPDYVFDQKYKLSSLKELESYIQQHQHLPDVPSAKEIENNGLHVGDVQKVMMEKIEELTLHIISLNKRIELLENQSRP